MLGRTKGALSEHMQCALESIYRYDRNSLVLCVCLCCEFYGLLNFHFKAKKTSYLTPKSARFHLIILLLYSPAMEYRNFIGSVCC